MTQDMHRLAKKNPVVFELEMFSRGLKIDPSVSLEGKRKPLRIRAGLGSGLEMMVSGIDDWRMPYLTINAPLYGDFVQSSPYTLAQEKDSYYVLHNNEIVREVFLYPLPKFYNQKTTDGIRMCRIGCIFGNVGSFMAKRCLLWETDPKMNCHFCATGLYTGDTEETEKTTGQIVEVANKMVFEEHVDSLHFNSGYREGDGIKEMIPIIQRVYKETGAYICVQCAPSRDFALYDALYKAGARHVSFCFEIFDEHIFRKICPGKGKYIQHKTFFDAMKHCVSIFPDVAGELIAGIEPIESTMNGIEAITDIGAWPTVTVFRPLPGTKMENEKPPATSELIPIVRRMYTACIEKNISIEQLPQIRESLSPLPMDGKYLLDVV